MSNWNGSNYNYKEYIYSPFSSFGLKFNGNKCHSLSLNKGEHVESFLIIPQLAFLDNEIYLGIHIGLKLIFSTTKELGPKLNLISDSALVP